MLKRLIPALALIAACQSAAAETPAPEAASWRPVDPENLLLFDMGEEQGVIALELFPEAAPANAAALRGTWVQGLRVA